jgi:hypothetical protein
MCLEKDEVATLFLWAALVTCCIKAELHQGSPRNIVCKHCSNNF